MLNRGENITILNEKIKNISREVETIHTKILELKKNFWSLKKSLDEFNSRLAMIGENVS